MKRFVLVLSLSIGIAQARFALATPLLAQVDITSQNRKSVDLVPGGPLQKVRFLGTQFDCVREIQIIKDNRRVRSSLRVELKRIGKGIVDLELQAAPEAATGEYRLNFIYTVGHDRVPVDVRVLDPNPPSPSPSPKPEQTPRSGWFHP